MLSGTPDCSSMGELINVEDHDFVWTKRSGPILVEDNALHFSFPEDKAIWCHSIDNVCYLPEERLQPPFLFKTPAN